MPPNFYPATACQRSRQLQQLGNRQRRNLAALTPVLCCLLVLSGCTGLRHARRSALDRSAEILTSHLQTQSSQQQTSIAGSAATTSTEPSNIALAGHQEFVDDHPSSRAVSPAPTIHFAEDTDPFLPPKFAAEQSMNVRPTMQPPAFAPATSVPPQVTGVQNFPQGPYASPPTTNVVRAQGDRFRQPQQTATELLVKMRAENEKMIVQIRAQKLAYSNLLNELKAERASHQQTMTKLDGSASEADQLRKLSAALQVKVDRLAKEKVDMKRQSDIALKKIEASLDAVLLESIARARQTSSTGN